MMLLLCESEPTISSSSLESFCSRRFTKLFCVFRFPLIRSRLELDSEVESFRLWSPDFEDPSLSRSR